MQGAQDTIRNPVDTRNSPHAALTPISLTGVRLTDGFWAQQQRVNREASLEHGYRKLVESGVIRNFMIAAGREEGDHSSMFFADTDLYKWLEAACYELAITPDKSIQERVDDAIELIGAVQMDDGYINTFFQITGIDDRWEHLENHMLFVTGHLLQAAIAHSRTSGKKNFLEIACKLADHVDSVFGPGKKDGAPDHPGVEEALVELYRETGEKRYLDLVGYFMDMRGRGLIKGGYFRWAYLNRGLYAWDNQPIREAKEASGHAVMQVYLLSGLTDVYLETGEKSLLDTALRLWDDIALGKTSINGGVGVRPKVEAFGLPYELPNESTYNETCAQIGTARWNWRMLLATGEARFADMLEWTLYNGVLCGVSLDGTSYFYGNPLLSRRGGSRTEWNHCACCPPNLMRTLSSIQANFATTSPGQLQIHLYDSASIRDDVPGVGRVELEMQTRYPWDGVIRLRIDSNHDTPWEISLRIPAWSRGAKIAVNNETIDTPCEPGTYAVIRRDWKHGDTVELQLDTTPRLVVAHPNVEPTRAAVAVTRGPLLYCIEGIDQVADAGVLDLVINPDAALRDEWREDLLGGMIVVKAAATVPDRSGWSRRLYRDRAEVYGEQSGNARGGSAGKADTPSAVPAAASGRSNAPLSGRTAELVAIPYYAWANRGRSPMRVWIPTTE